MQLWYRLHPTPPMKNSKLGDKDVDFLVLLNVCHILPWLPASAGTIAIVAIVVGLWIAQGPAVMAIISTQTRRQFPLNNKNTNNEASAQDMVPAFAKTITRYSQLDGFTPKDSKIVIDATKIYANGFSQGYAMGKDRSITE